MQSIGGEAGLMLRAMARSEGLGGREPLSQGLHSRPVTTHSTATAPNIENGQSLCR